MQGHIHSKCRTLNIKWKQGESVPDKDFMEDLLGKDFATAVKTVKN